MVLLLLGCVLPPNPTVYQLCMAEWRAACECEEEAMSHSSGGEDAPADWACSQDWEGHCEIYHPDVCEPASGIYDQGRCDRLLDLSKDTEKWECRARAWLKTCELDTPECDDL